MAAPGAGACLLEAVALPHDPPRDSLQDLLGGKVGGRGAARARGVVLASPRIAKGRVNPPAAVARVYELALEGWHERKKGAPTGLRCGVHSTLGFQCSSNCCPAAHALVAHALGPEMEPKLPGPCHVAYACLHTPSLSARSTLQ